MNTKNTTIVAIIVILLVVIVAWKMHGSAQPAGSTGSVSTSTTTDNTQGTSSGQTSIEQYAGTVSTSTSGQLVYTSDKEGLKLTLPKGWHIGSNALGYGTLQFFNYDENTAPGKDSFPSNGKINKIEATITTNASFTTTPDFPASASTTKEVTIAGQNATRVDVTMADGGKMRLYFIPLTSQPGKYLGITIYGDVSNFPVLDQVVQSLSFAK